MKTYLVSITIGLVAGRIDILPILLQKQNKASILSAFLQYFFVSMVIVNINLPGIPWWLQGGLVSLAPALPIMVIVSQSERQAVPIIAGGCNSRFPDWNCRALPEIVMD